MNKEKSSKGLMGVGLLSAIAASLCCITPVLALIAGSSGIAATFSWIQPARPYLIGITILVLGFAWYQKLKPKSKEEIDCVCEENEKPTFLQSKKFLGIVTMFAALMLTFPYYSHMFFPKSERKVVIVESNNITEANFDISGMTCQGCEEEVIHEVAQLPGFIETKVNYETGKAVVKFDKSKSTLDDFVTAINKTGYKVVHQKEVKK